MAASLARPLCLFPPKPAQHGPLAHGPPRRDLRSCLSGAPLSFSFRKAAGGSGRSGFPTPICGAAPTLGPSSPVLDHLLRAEAAPPATYDDVGFFADIQSSPLLDPVFLVAELSPQNAALIATFLGPTLATVNCLFIFRIVMSWYPQLPVKDFPYSFAYIPTEPILSLTRRLVPPVGGVDVAPVIWLAFFSFINEILLGQQGLLILISQQKLG